MMKLPFHTTAKSTARLLMSMPSYWYCGERGRGTCHEEFYPRESGCCQHLRVPGNKPGTLVPFGPRERQMERQELQARFTSSLRCLPPTPSHGCQQDPAQTPLLAFSTSYDPIQA